MGTGRVLIRGLAGLLTLFAWAVAVAQPTAVVPPLPLPGPYAVACSNVAQDFTRMAPGEDVQTYWEGVPRSDGSPRYITDLLSDPGNTLSVTITAPNDASVYGSFAGKTLAVTVIVCYPTTATNSRADYPLPNGVSVPHMQLGGDAPILPDPSIKWPMVVFSHGFLGSPLSNDYLQAVEIVASYGYIVAAPFHGDARIAQFQLESFNDIAYALTHLADYLALQALRPLALSATIDLMLGQTQWSAQVDATRIGGFGASLGGESLLLMSGAGLTTSIGLSWTKIDTDARLKAAVGYVPYFGQPVFPAFGRDQHGLDDVTLPFLAISGTADTTAPLASTMQGMQHLAGTRELVALTGVTHGFDVASTNDIFTWTLTFLDAQVRNDAAASVRLAQMGAVAGGGDDHVLLDVNAQPPALNYSGLWWNSPGGSESGWGINFAHQADVIFATWFTYADDHTALWLSMTATKVSEGVYSGTLYRTTGPPFYSVPFDPSLVVRTPVGTGTLTFVDGNNAFFAYAYDGVAQTKAITREAFGPIPTCTWGVQTNLAQATNYQDLWWNPSESGWGINFAHEGATIFATWFTYDVDGSATWLSMTAQNTGQPGVFVGDLYRSTGPPFSAVPFDPTSVGRILVGNASLTFVDGADAMFSYNVSGTARNETITRQIFRPPGTLCQ
jgi:predicted dienelactone hydrolase